MCRGKPINHEPITQCLVCAFYSPGLVVVSFTGTDCTCTISTNDVSTTISANLVTSTNWPKEPYVCRCRDLVVVAPTKANATTVAVRGRSWEFRSPQILTSMETRNLQSDFAICNQETAVLELPASSTPCLTSKLDENSAFIECVRVTLVWFASVGHCGLCRTKRFQNVPHCHRQASFGKRYRFVHKKRKKGALLQLLHLQQ